jgi:hypothetical protein
VYVQSAGEKVHEVTFCGCGNKAVGEAVEKAVDSLGFQLMGEDSFTSNKQRLLSGKYFGLIFLQAH